MEDVQLWLFLLRLPEQQAVAIFHRVSREIHMEICFPSQNFDLRDSSTFTKDIESAGIGWLDYACQMKQIHAIELNDLFERSL